MIGLSGMANWLSRILVSHLRDFSFQRGKLGREGRYVAVQPVLPLWKCGRGSLPAEELSCVGWDAVALNASRNSSVIQTFCFLNNPVSGHNWASVMWEESY